MVILGSFLSFVVFSLEKKRGDRVGVCGERERERELRCCLSDASTWSPKLSELIKTSQVNLLPYDLILDYDYWNYRMYVQRNDFIRILNLLNTTTR